MSYLGVNPHAVTNPDLIHLADLNLRIRLHKSDLSLKLFGLPQIIRIQKTKVGSMGPAHPEVPRRCHTTLRLDQHIDSGTKLAQLLDASIIRSIIHHDDFMPLIALFKNRLDGFANHWPAIMGGNNDAYEKHTTFIPKKGITFNKNGKPPGS